MLELSAMLDRSSGIFELGTSKYIIIPCMVFGSSDDMLELCPILSLTQVGDLCILQQPESPKASNLRPDFRNNMVS